LIPIGEKGSEPPRRRRLTRGGRFAKGSSWRRSPAGQRHLADSGAFQAANRNIGTNGRGVRNALTFDGALRRLLPFKGDRRGRAFVDDELEDVGAGIVADGIEIDLPSRHLAEIEIGK